jgi:hypothetical protein
MYNCVQMEGNPIPPPPAYAAYPRADYGQVYGTSEKLTRLYRGYHGLSYTFLCIFVGIVFMIAAGSVSGAKGSDALVILFFLLAAAGYLASFYFSVRSGLDIGFGNGWAPATGVILGIIAPIVGIIMIVVMQYLAIGEMTRYGIKNRAFRGISKATVKERIAQLAAMENGSQPVAQG